MVYRFQLTYDEIIYVSDLNYISTESTGYSLNPGIYEVSDIDKTVEFVLLDNVIVNATIDDIRIKSSLKINQTLNFTEKSFYYTISGFTQSHFYLLDDIE